MVFLKNALRCIKKAKLINHDCLPISMLLYTMLYIILAHLMLFAALSNAVCLHNAFFILIFANAFCFHALSWFIDSLFISSIESCAVILICWFFQILCSYHLLYERAICSLE